MRDIEGKRGVPRNWRIVTGARSRPQSRAWQPRTPRRRRAWPMRHMRSLVALAVLVAIGVLHYGLPDLPFDLPITSEPVAAGASITGRASVIDGDTIEIQGERIRLLDIDAPESRQPCTAQNGSEWRCGQKASIALSDWIGARTVNCETDKLDRYGRHLARCAVAGDDLGQWMADHGWVVPYGDCKCEAIRDAADRAKSAQLGIWSGSFMMPWEWRKQH